MKCPHRHRRVRAAPKGVTRPEGAPRTPRNLPGSQRVGRTGSEAGLPDRARLQSKTSTAGHDRALCPVCFRLLAGLLVFFRSTQESHLYCRWYHLSCLSLCHLSDAFNFKPSKSMILSSNASVVSWMNLLRFCRL